MSPTFMATPIGSSRCQLERSIPFGREACNAGPMAADRSTRDRILDVALDLFGSRGFDAVSLDEIAREVGVRKQTVLYWFPSKDELLDAVLDAVAGELVVVIDAAVRSAPPDDPLERI